MTKDFYYHVAGTEFHDTIAFGDAWKKAKALAKEKHTTIERRVVRGEDIRHEFLAKGGVFLLTEYYKPEKALVF